MSTDSPTIETTLTLRLTEETRRKLAERAAQDGRDMSDYASGLIEQAVSRPTLEELLAPVRADFTKSGMSDDQIMELGRKELDALRKERKAKSA